MTISEASKQYDLTADTLRYYERIGLLPPIPRTKSGIRNYTEEECNWIEFVKCMRGAGVSVDALVEYIALFHEGPETLYARKNLLVAQHAQLAEKFNDLKAVLERLDRKIENYDEIIFKYEEEHLK